MLKSPLLGVLRQGLASNLQSSSRLGLTKTGIIYITERSYSWELRKKDIFLLQNPKMSQKRVLIKCPGELEGKSLGVPPAPPHCLLLCVLWFLYFFLCFPFVCFREGFLVTQLCLQFTEYLKMTLKPLILPELQTVGIPDLCHRDKVNIVLLKSRKNVSKPFVPFSQISLLEPPG